MRVWGQLRPRYAGTIKEQGDKKCVNTHPPAESKSELLPLLLLCFSVAARTSKFMTDRHVEITAYKNYIKSRYLNC